MTQICHFITIPTVPFNLAEKAFSAHGTNLLASLAGYPDFMLEQNSLHLFLILVLVLVNGFFVAAEVALIKLRTAQLETANRKFISNAVITRKIVDKLEQYVIACKFGAALATLLLGSVSIPYVFAKLNFIVENDWLHSRTASLSVAFIAAIFIVATVLVIIGKIIPNTVGFRREEAVSFRCSRLLYFFYHVFALLIIPITKISNWILKTIFHLEPASDREPDYSVEDLKNFVEETDDDEVTETERDILINALELSDLKVLDIVTPRSEVVALDVKLPFEENLTRAITSKHTRFPLIREHLDETLGWIHIKDLIVMMRHKKPNLAKTCREILRVSEDMPLDQLLESLLEHKTNLALVIDEFGGAQGIVMRDQILKLLIGEDVYDRDKVGENPDPMFEKISDDEFLVDGSIPLHELDDLIPELALESLDVRTVGGYVTSKFGYLPDPGETAEIEGFMMEVTEVDEKKIIKLRINRILEDTPMVAS